MNLVSFLDQIQNILLEENEKENQILSQKVNKQKSSNVSSDKVPFAQLKQAFKSKKKITFLLKNKEKQSQGDMEDSIGIQLKNKKASMKKEASKVSKVSTNPTLNVLQSFEEKKKQKYELVFPSNFEEKMKILKTLR